jgi:heme o synthase
VSSETDDRAAAAAPSTPPEVVSDELGPAPPVGPAADAVGPMHARGRYEGRGTRRDVIRRYVLVTKPRIIELLLITAVPTMVVAQGGWPDTWLVVATVLGGTLSAASANALNNYCDRDVDRLMARTSSRPTASDEVSARGTLILGLVLGVAGFVWLAVFVNPLAAGLATFAIPFYVFVYTLGLKRRTSQAVVIGGVAGCMPVLTGWAAVPGTTLSDPRPWLLFAVMFWWQPPHFWALAMKYREDYARAGLPMLPVTHGNDETTRQILLSSYLLLSIVLLSTVGLQAGWLYSVVALGLTFGWLRFAHRLRRSRTVADAMRLFHYSTVYIAVLFIVAAVDAVLIAR